MRQATVERNTKETQIMAEIALDGSGTYDVSTGIGFLDHMLEQFSRHSLIDLKVCRAICTSTFTTQPKIPVMWWAKR